ncbi:hypothetical protein F4604DRAFT_1577812, partial [Suillus subluteus]
QSTFETVVHTHLYPHSTIDIFIHVLQLDSGLLPALPQDTGRRIYFSGIPS